MDEFEENSLDESPSTVKYAVSKLIPFNYEGYINTDPDSINRVARILANLAVYVSDLTVTGETHLKVRGYRSDVGDYLDIQLKGLLSGVSSAKPELTFSILTTNIDSSIQNVKTALNVLDPEWTGGLQITRTTKHLEFKVLGATTTKPEAIISYNTTHQGSHQALTFNATSLQKPSFILPYLSSQLTDNLESEIMDTFYDLDLVSGGVGEYIIQYRSSDIENFEVFDETIELVMDKLLSDQGELRYYSPGTNTLEGMFQALEDLIPTGVGFVSPYDRSLQLYYNRIQGYEGADTMNQLLQRRNAFFATKQIWRTFQQKLLSATKHQTLHYIAKYFSRLRSPLQICVEGEMMTVSGNILSLNDAIAIYILLINAQQASVDRQYSVLPQLEAMEMGLTASELVHGLSGMTVYSSPCASGVKCSLEVKEASHRHIITLPATLVPSHKKLLEYLRQKDEDVDVVRLCYRDNGTEYDIYSIYTTLHLARDEILGNLQSPFEDMKTPPVIESIASADYQFDITLIGDYYRCDVVASGSDKPNPRFTLLWIPSWVLLDSPDMLERVSLAWRRGHLIAPFSLEVYRLTQKLWTPNCIPAELTPVVWEKLSSSQVLSLLKKVVTC
ncbi:MAG: hypothetical protein WC208_14325 [Gallionella sp.]